MSQTIQNLHNALASESISHIKSLYFAKLAREEGFEDIASHFERTADQELHHAWDHLDLIIGKPTTKECLELAVEDATNNCVVYPEYKKIAIGEEQINFAVEARANNEEAKEHIRQLGVILKKAELRFAALATVKEQHADAYKEKLKTL